MRMLGSFVCISTLRVFSEMIGVPRKRSVRSAEEFAGDVPARLERLTFLGIKLNRVLAELLASVGGVTARRLTSRLTGLPK